MVELITPHVCDEWCWVAVWHGIDPPAVLDHGNLIELDHGTGQVLVERRCKHDDDHGPGCDGPYNCVCGAVV